MLCGSGRPESLEPGGSKIPDHQLRHSADTLRSFPSTSLIHCHTNLIPAQILIYTSTLFSSEFGGVRPDYSPESHPASAHFWFDGGSKRQQRTPGPAQYQGGFTPLIISRPTCRWIAQTQARKFARQNRMHVCIRFSVHCGGVAAASRCPPPRFQLSREDAACRLMP